MTEANQKQLGNTFWSIADQLRGAISTAVGEAEIVLNDTHQKLVEIEKAIAAAKDKHNSFLRELGLKPLP